MQLENDSQPSTLLIYYASHTLELVFFRFNFIKKRADAIQLMHWMGVVVCIGLYFQVPSALRNAFRLQFFFSLYFFHYEINTPATTNQHPCRWSIKKRLLVHVNISMLINPQTFVLFNTFIASCFVLICLVILFSLRLRFVQNVNFFN